MILAEIGTNELILIPVVIVAFIIVVFRFVFKYGKQKGRLEELEKRVNDPSKKA